jgi:galactonate dehydratase
MTRRDVLAAASLPLLRLQEQALAAGSPKATLQGIEIFRVPVNKRGDWVLVRVRTDQGVMGIGDASHGTDEITIRNLRGLFDQMKGRSFTDIEHLRKTAEPVVQRDGMSGATALGGIEQAMWDIAGQIFGVPVYALFGGKLRDAVRNYANINRSTFDRTPQGFAKWAEDAVKNGFDAIKLAPFDGWPKDASKVEAHIQLGLECARAIRQAAGPKADILIDAHSHFTLERGLQLAREFEPLNLFWLEEVTPGIENLARLNQAAKMPTAGGESIFGVKGFHPYIAGGAVDIIMPDIKYCGGLLEMKKIAAMGEGAGLPVSPHGPASPVGNIAAAHVCATLPNFLILEYGYGEVPWRRELVEPVEPIVKGQMILNGGSGFGFTLNERSMKRLASRV